MIDFISGKISDKSPTNVVVENNGIGYDLQISLNTYQQLTDVGSIVRLKTYLHVREDILQLFAFSTDKERIIFKGLISISGIGPKLAQTVLSGITPTELLEAIQNNDVERLTAISGIGKKTAQRLVIELKEKFSQLGLVADASSKAAIESILSPIEKEASMALLSLGYKKPMVEKSLARVRKKGIPDSVEEIIKQALQQI